MPVQKNEKPLAILQIRKGMIEEVYANVPLKVVVVDWDTQGVEEGTPGVLSVPLDGSGGDTELCFAAFLSPRGLTRLPRSLRKALQDHGYLPAASPSSKRRKGEILPPRGVDCQNHTAGSSLNETTHRKRSTR